MRPGLLVKLAVLLAIFGILASGITGYYAYTVNRAMLVSAAQSDLLTAARGVNRRLSQSVEEAADDALLLSRLVTVPGDQQPHTRTADGQERAGAGICRHAGPAPGIPAGAADRRG
jgi:Tfp pilus assembly protein PilE